MTWQRRRITERHLAQRSRGVTYTQWIIGEDDDDDDDDDVEDADGAANDNTGQDEEMIDKGGGEEAGHGGREGAGHGGGEGAGHGDGEGADMALERTWTPRRKIRQY